MAPPMQRTAGTV
jgi:GTP cyclohydrolase I